MLDTLRDLFVHQEWADALHWRAITAHPAAAADEEIRARLYHIHIVQRGFLLVWRGMPQRPPEPEAFPTLRALRDFAREGHRELAAFAGSLTGDRLDERFTIPWFEDPPCTLPLRETMVQVAMHSQHHRGQNATRLRALGGEPPLVDWIVWLWKGKPAPAWD